MRVVVSAFPGYLGTLDACGAEHILSLAKPERYEIFGKGLSVLLGKNRRKSAVAHINRFGDILKHQIWIGKM